MIEYFTALVIAYNLQGEQIKTVAWFKSQSHCQTVMNENLAQPLYDHIYDLYGNDISMQCIVSKQPSKTLVRPKPRPEK
tara:strand:+ start:478 stop:714 length:237 start_codon:yes stop_codon:yes gene_type:complete